MSNDKPQVINVKLDAENKSKFETLAFIRRCSLQKLCIDLIMDALEENADKIAEIEKQRD